MTRKRKKWIEQWAARRKAREDWERSCKQAETSYLAMMSGGVKPQIARAVLPQCLKVGIVMKTNFHSWRNFFYRRCAKDAHPQIRAVALMALHELYKAAPNVFEDQFKQYIADPMLADLNGPRRQAEVKA